MNRRKQTEWQLVGGGFGILLFAGHGLLWLLYGRTTALLSLAVFVGAIILFALLWLLLRALERWASGEPGDPPG